MALNMSRHIEMLKVYLDAYDNPESMKKRIDSLEAVLAIKPGEAGFPSRQHMLMEVAFMVKQKQKIIDFITEPKYMDVFQRSVKFLEKNPDPPKKKPAKADAMAELYRAYTIPMTTYRSWYAPTFDNPTPPEPVEAPVPDTQGEVMRWDSLPLDEHGYSIAHGDPADRESRTSMETAHPQPRSSAEILRDLSTALSAQADIGDLAPGAAVTAMLNAQEVQRLQNDMMNLASDLEEEAAARAGAGSD